MGDKVKLTSITADMNIVGKTLHFPVIKVKKIKFHTTPNKDNR
jgi:hypothetical protein